ncbi:16S rRNA (guanine(966)-N(2))-methyltransferase RsmD [Candidatus Dojkabacteria bacterium]|nr:16S rRNA (guanine(966)-N(2))-methyltransferase RsmD [Candidatus Dojkabacteria bacterium]
MLRIATGKYKNKKLKVCQSVTRPFTERMRISVLDLLKDYIQGASILDLYAGSGAVGIETLSRGAKKATFIENDRKAYEILRENIMKANVEENTETYCISVHDFIRRSKYKFDIIFLDPPFSIQQNKNSIVDVSHLSEIMHADSIIALRVEKEMYKKKRINYEGLKEIYFKKFGRSIVVFYSIKI